MKTPPFCFESLQLIFGSVQFTMCERLAVLLCIRATERKVGQNVNVNANFAAFSFFFSENWIAFRSSDVIICEFLRKTEF